MKRISILFLTIIVLIHAFSAKSQINPKAKPPAWMGLSIGSTKEGVSPEVMDEYETIVSKYMTSDEEWWKNIERNISTEDRNRLEQIFKQMSKEQQAKQKIAFIKTAPPLKKVIPSGKQFNSWKNVNVYGVWIDGKRIANTALYKYNSADFNQVTVSKLYGPAKKNKKYFYQVDLMTKEYYRKYYAQSIAKGIRMVFKA